MGEVQVGPFERLDGNGRVADGDTVAKPGLRLPALTNADRPVRSGGARFIAQDAFGLGIAELPRAIDQAARRPPGRRGLPSPAARASDHLVEQRRFGG